MKQQNSSIILTRVEENLTNCGQILDNAEKVVLMLDSYKLGETYERIKLTTIDKLFPLVFPIHDDHLQSFGFRTRETAKKTYVIMLTHHEPEYTNLRYSYLGGDYFIEKIASFDWVPFDISIIQLS